MSENRELVVTVRARKPLIEVVDAYKDSITPDGGNTGTLNEWIAEYAQTLITEMSPGDCVVESADWQIRTPGFGTGS